MVETGTKVLRAALVFVGSLIALSGRFSFGRNMEFTLAPNMDFIEPLPTKGLSSPETLSQRKGKNWKSRPFDPLKL